MTPAFLNSSSPNSSNNSPFHGGLNEDNHRDHQHHLFFGPYPQVAASSSSYSCHFFFNSAQDQTGYYHTTEICQPLQQIDQDNGYASHGGSYESENKVGDFVKLSPEIEVRGNGDQADDKNNPAKWMSSKMRFMQKMKNTDCSKGFDEMPTKKNTGIKKIRQDQKQPSTSLEPDYSSNGSSNNSNSTTTPIRVCADCNTTKTPLWRSGPKGPKSLCNACGIRQRKARRALAAAAAAGNNAPQPITETPKVKIKVHHKEKTKNSTGQLAVPFKKRCKVTLNKAEQESHQQQEPKKLGFEDYLIKLSKNLAFHHVFPQDEKEAAILLMALSCGLVHG